MSIKNKLQNILTEYEASGHVEDFLAHNLSLTPEFLQQDLWSLSPPEQDKLLRILGKLQSDLTDYIAQTERAKDEVKSQLSSHAKSLSACLKYGGTQGLRATSPGRDEE